MVPLIRPDEGFISHGGTLHGGRLASHETMHDGRNLYSQVGDLFRIFINVVCFRGQFG